jgi:hypothetical protein
MTAPGDDALLSELDRVWKPSGARQGRLGAELATHNTPTFRFAPPRRSAAGEPITTTPILPSSHPAGELKLRGCLDLGWCRAGRFKGARRGGAGFEIASMQKWSV